MIALPTLAATEELAAHLAPILRRGDVLALRGDLGAGKTSFARALLRSLGITGDVPSPTFTLVQTYETPVFPLAHFDLYRLKDAGELDELGFDDALAGGVTVVEWPERAGTRLPNDCLHLHFTIAADGQHGCAIEGGGDWPQRLRGLHL